MTEREPKGAPLPPAAPADGDGSARGTDGLPPLDYQALLEHLPAGVVVHAPDSSVRFANQQACRLLGMTLDQMTGKHARDPAWRFVRDDESPMPLGEYPVQRVLDTGEAIHEQVVGIEHTGPTDRTWVLVNAFPELEGGVLRQVVVTFTDITARKEMESELRKRKASLRASEARYRNLFEAGSDALFLIDCASGQILDANEAATSLYGYSREELLKLENTDLSAEPEQTAAATRPPELPPAGYRVTIPGRRHRRRDGTDCLVDITARFFDLEDRRVHLASIRDVTERTRAEADRRQLEVSLARADRLSSMGTLAAGVAHEINNPLTFVLFNLEALANEIPERAQAVIRARQRLEDRLGAGPLREVVGPDLDAFDPKVWAELEELYQSGLEGGRRIRDIVRGLGTFSRVDDETLTSVDLRIPIDAALNMAANEIKHRARLIRELGPTQPVLANEGRLSQVFLNLIVNAAHAIEEGDTENNTLRVRTWQEGDSIFAEVEDTGSGIAPERLAQIFEPFFTTKGIGVGSGLGLSIVRNIVTELGGEIEVTSELGKGSRFKVRLPAAASDAGTARPAVSPEPAPGEARGRLLLIDDEAQIRQALKRILSQHEVVEAESGEQACAILEGDQAFDLILSDVMMPKMSGIELHRWLETNHPALARRLVFVSGGAFTPQSQAYLESVENRQLAKPFDLQRVRQVIQQLLQEDGDQTP